MTAENYILAIVAGFIAGWIANAMTRSRYSFPINLFVGIFGAILLNFFVQTADLLDDRFMSILLVSLAGSAVLLLLFHLTRLTEKH
jgi:uncharacterized membrane protein YeaQ/YmgE (transglycosylase-associated protein family)